MFGTIRRHQKWLWIVIVFLTVVSFVYFFNPNQKVSDTRRGSEKFGEIKGKEVSREDYESVLREVYLQYRLTHGEWPDKDPMAKQFGFEPQMFTYRRLLFIREQEERNIKVGDDTVRRMATEILHPAKDKAISPEDFEKQVLRERGMTLLDFENFLRHEIGLQQLITTVGLPGRLVTPQEAEYLYRLLNEDISAEIAYFPASNYLAGVTVNSNALAQFFQQHQAEYKIPERIQVNYVKYDLTNFNSDADARLGRVTNLSEVVDFAKRHFREALSESELKITAVTNLDRLAELVYRKRGGTNYYKEVKSPDEATEKIKNELRENEQRFAARKKANEIADPLLSAESPKPEMLSAVAASNGLTVKVTAPFSLNDETNELKLLPKLAGEPFKLMPESPFAGPLDGQDAIYFIGFNKRIASENPPLDSIRSRVVADCAYTLAVERARQAAEDFSRSFTTNASGPVTNFSVACKSGKGEYIKPPPFSLSTRKLPEVEDRLSLGQLQNVAFVTPAGKVSATVPMDDGAFVFHVIERVPADAAKLQQELPAFLASLRQSRQQDAFNQWFQKQVQQEPVFREITSGRSGGK